MNDQRMVDVGLLEEVVAFCEFWKQERGLSLRDKVKAIIDGPGVDPVAWIHPMDVGRFPSVQFERLNDEMLPLYLASPSAPVARCHECWACPTDKEK